MSMIPTLKRMSYIVIGISPIVVWAMLMLGWDIYVAILTQLIGLAMMLSASSLSLLLTLIIAKRYVFDAYGNLKSNEKEEKTEA